MQPAHICLETQQNSTPGVFVRVREKRHSFMCFIDQLDDSSTRSQWSPATPLSEDDAGVYVFQSIAVDAADESLSLAALSVQYLIFSGAVVIEAYLRNILSLLRSKDRALPPVAIALGTGGTDDGAAPIFMRFSFDDHVGFAMHEAVRLPDLYGVAGKCVAGQR